VYGVSSEGLLLGIDGVVRQKMGGTQANNTNFFYVNDEQTHKFRLRPDIAVGDNGEESAMSVNAAIKERAALQSSRQLVRLQLAEAVGILKVQFNSFSIPFSKYSDLGDLAKCGRKPWKSETHKIVCTALTGLASFVDCGIMLDCVETVKWHIEVGSAPSVRILSNRPTISHSLFFMNADSMHAPTAAISDAGWDRLSKQK